MDDLVSIIITSKDEEKNIGNLLESIKLQTYKNIELILVDNFSKDKTLEIAKNYKVKIINHGKERSEQRNIGIKSCNGEYALYLDADMILTPDLVTNLIKEIKLDNYDGIFIKEIILGNSLFNICRNYERKFYEESNIDAIRFFKLEKYKEIGGFDEEITGQEDWDFSIRFNKKNKSKLLKRKINRKLIDESCSFFNKFINSKNIEFEGILHNEINFRLKDHIEKKKYYLKTFKYYKNKYKNHNSFQQQFAITGRLRIYFSYKNLLKIFLKPHLFLLMIIFKIYVFFNAGFNKL